MIPFRDRHCAAGELRSRHIVATEFLSHFPRQSGAALPANCADALTQEYD